MSDRHLFVVIPVHDRLELTRACLAALERQTMRDFTVVVVDDGSTDGTPEALRHEFPRTVVLTGDGSLWWTGAMNVGVGWVLARASAADFVLTLNNDTVPPDDYLAGMLRAHEEAPRALVGSLLVSAQDGRTIVDGGVHITWLTAKYRTSGRGALLEADAASAPRLVPVDVLSGCGTLVPLMAYRAAGPYDQKHLRHYGADLEFSRRARRSGFALFVDWASPLLVDETETGIHATAAERGLASLMRSFWDTRSANDFRARLRFAVAACPRWALPAYLPLDYARVVAGSARRLLSRSNVTPT
jgi:GT2 family glycosyltransferase